MEWIFITLASLLAGFIDAIVGGGGLILTPALFAAFPGAAPATLFGTNKAGSVWGTDPDRVAHVVAGVRTGTLSVNGGVWYSADAPFGGYKQSGIGREMGLAGFEEYLETKLVASPS